MNPLKLLLFISLVGFITAFPSGAPANICGRYVPGGHRNLGTPVASGPRTGPYKIEATPNGNGQFTVTLQSTTSLPFAGYVIQAVPSWKQLPDGPSDIVGSFQPDFQNGQYQVRSCGGRMGGSNVLTHTSGVNKTRVSATWQAPRNLPDPNVKFIATVVQNFDNFYVAHSSPVNVQGGSTVGGQGGAGSFNIGTGSRGQGSFTSGGQGFSTTGSSFAPGTSGQSQMGSGGFFGSSTSGAGTTAFGGSSSNTGADNNATLGGGISVISDAPEPIQLFSPDPPPPIVLPNGKISIHSFDSSAQSVPITTQNTSFTSSTLTISSNSGQPSPVSPTVSSSSLASSNDQTFEGPPNSSSTTFRSWASSSTKNTAISSPTLPSLPQVTSAIDPTSSSLKVTVSETTSDAQGSATGSLLSPIGDLTLETLLSKPSSTDVSASLSSTDAIQSVEPSLNIIDISTTNFITDSATKKAFDRTNILADLSSPVNIEIPPSRPSDPTINIIEIPILPEGKTAALINITNGQVTPSSIRRLNGIERFIGPGLSNRRRSSVGSTQGQSGMGQGQTGMGQGQMTSTFGQMRPPFTGMGNQFSGFSSSFGRPTGSQFSGPSGMASGGMFGGPRFSGAGSFGGRSFGVSGFPGSRSMGMGPFGASGPGMMPGAGGMSFGPGSTGGSSIGGQSTFGQESGTGSFGMPGGQTTSFGGTSPFGGQSSMFGGQGGSPFGGQTMIGGPFGPQFGGGSFGGPGPFGAGGPGMFRGRPLGPFGQGSAFTGSLGSGSPAGSFGMGDAGQTGFGGSGGSSGQTFNSFASSGTTGTFGGSFGSPGSSGATDSFGTQFGPGISQGQGQTGSQGQSNSQSMFSPQGPTGAGTQLSGGSTGFSAFGPGTSSSGAGSGSTQTFGATGQGPSGLNSFSFSG